MLEARNERECRCPVSDVLLGHHPAEINEWWESIILSRFRDSAPLTKRNLNEDDNPLQIVSLREDRKIAISNVDSPYLGRFGLREVISPLSRAFDGGVALPSAEGYCQRAAFGLTSFHLTWLIYRLSLKYLT